MPNRTDSMEDTSKPPIAESIFADIADHPFYIDKTLLIKEMIDRRPYVILFARPYGFGKSLTLDMLRTYFEKSQKDTAVYFKDKEIWRYGKRYTDMQGRFPVIMLKFRDTRIDSFEDFLNIIRTMLREEVQRRPELFHSRMLKDHEINLLESMKNGTLSAVMYSRALLELTGILRKHHGSKVIVLIDNYDMPMLKSFSKNCRREIKDFMSRFLAAGLKDNSHLAFSVLTGIMPIVLADEFGGFNNLIAYTILDSNYGEHFGFTDTEMQRLAAQNGILNRTEEIRRWYGGYHIGNLDLCCPASVFACLCSSCRPAVYRTISKEREILHTLITRNAVIRDDLLRLLAGEEIHTFLDMHSLDRDITKGENPLCYLAAAGYLSAVPSICEYSFLRPVSLKIPNQEIHNLLTGIFADALRSS